jgi:hypothetical protein
MCHCNSHVDFVTNGVVEDCLRIRGTYTFEGGMKQGRKALKL